MARWFPEALAATFAVFFIVLGLAPASREVWWAEVIPVALVFLYFLATARRFRFSNTAYALMAVWLFLHTIGGHYTFAAVPFGFVTDLFGFSRNHFDRMAHFTVGFYAFPLAEYLWRRRLAHPVVIALFGITLIMAVACAYEIIEWWYAAAEGGQTGIEFLGSQGDVWDAQKDMLADTLGAVAAIALFWAMRRRLPQDPASCRVLEKSMYWYERDIRKP
jgi:putative membrane protein